MISKSLVKYILTAALRDKLMVTLVLMILMAAAIAVFMGAASVTEGSSFALVFGAGGLRFLGVTGIVLFCCFYIRRSFENKEVEFLLSRPISRLSFLFSHALAFSILSFFIALIIVMTVSVIGRPSPEGLALWGTSLAAEFSIMAITALFFSIVLSSAAGSALATLGVYTLSRMAGTLLGIMDIPPANWIFAILSNIMELISIMIPRLDMMGQTTWLVYGISGSGSAKFLPNTGSTAYWMAEHLGLAGFISVQGLVFISLLLTATAYDFTRRQF